MLHVVESDLAGAIEDEAGRLGAGIVDSFRQVGEGTGRVIDLDAFDLFYEHLFVWDAYTRTITGAYRLADVDALRSEGCALYTESLFDYAPAFFDRVGPTVELGRSWAREPGGPTLALPRGEGRSTRSGFGLIITIAIVVIIVFVLRALDVAVYKHRQQLPVRKPDSGSITGSMFKCAWTSSRNQPLPRISAASMIPEDSSS